MRFRSLFGIALAASLVGVLGCPQPEPEPPDEVDPVAVPDTTAEAVWSHLQEADYEENWQLWPGTTELYEGGEPHGMLLTTYVNPAAHQAVTEGAGELPEGAIVVKENFMPDTTFDASTVMYKVSGYNPEHNDWYWMKRLEDGTVEAEGRVQGCIGCHSARADNDYILTEDLQR